MNDLNYLTTTYARAKKEFHMASYTTQANSYDNIFIHKVPVKVFTALEKLTGAVVHGELDKYLSFNIDNVQITVFQKEEEAL